MGLRGEEGCRSPEWVTPTPGSQAGAVSAHRGLSRCTEALPSEPSQGQRGGFQHAHFPYPQTYQQSKEKLIRVLRHRRKCLQIAFLSELYKFAS